MKYDSLIALYVYLGIGSYDLYRYLRDHDPVMAACAAFFLFGAHGLSSLLRAKKD